jgi:hypothetical protein
MEIPIKELVERTSARARVSFVLAVAERVIGTLRYDSAGYSKAVDALDLAWNWVETGKVTGSELYELLENEEDTGLLIHEWEAGEDEARTSAWICVTTAIAYASWHAYQRRNERAMPEPICEVSERAVSNVVEYASRTKNFDEDFVRRVCVYLISREQTVCFDSEGGSIERALLAKLS